MVSHQCIQETKIALISQTMENIENKLDKLDNTMSAFIFEVKDNYETKKESTERYERNKSEIKNLQKDMIDMKILTAKYTGIAIVISWLATFILNKIF